MPPLLEIKGDIPPSLIPTAVKTFKVIAGLKMRSTSNGHVRIQMDDSSWLVLRDTKYKDVLLKKDTILGVYEFDPEKPWENEGVKYFTGRLPEMETKDSIISAVDL